VSTAQLQKCSQRIEDEEARDEFLRLHEQATALIRRGVELRRAAWTLYYSSTGERPRAERNLFR
jgi:hypothetical protein